MNNTLTYLIAIWAFVYISQLIGPIAPPIKWAIAAFGLVLIVVVMAYSGLLHIVIH